MENITITNLNNIINDYRKKLSKSAEDCDTLRNKIKTLGEQLKNKK